MSRKTTGRHDRVGWIMTRQIDIVLVLTSVPLTVSFPSPFPHFALVLTPRRPSSPSKTKNGYQVIDSFA